MKKKELSLILSAVMLAGSINIPQALAKEDIAGWTTAGSNGGETSLSGDYYIDGENSLLLYGEKATSTATATTSFKAEKNKKYTFTFWAKNTGTSGFNCTIGSTGVSTTPVTKLYNWTKFKTEYKHTGNDKANVDITFKLNGAGKVYIDDIFVAETNTGEDNRIENPSFEEQGVVVLKDPYGIDRYSCADWDVIKNDFADKKVMPFLYMENFNCDGKLDEWENYPKASLPNDTCRTVINGYNGADDLSADFQTAFDDKNMYLSAVITDDVHFNDQTGSNYWNADSIQLAFGTMSEDFGIEVGFFLNKDGKPEVYSSKLDQTLWGAVDDYVLKLQEQTKCAVTRDGNQTIYEMVIPWDLHFEDGIPEDFLFNILINDNDGAGRKGYIEWTYGIGQSKSNSEFIAAVPVKKSGDLYAYIEGDKKINEKEDSWFKLFVVNDGSEDKEVTITIENTDPVTVKIPANNVYYHPFLINEDVIGTKHLEVGVTDGTNEFTATRNINVQRDLELAFPRFEENELAELYKLQKQCKEKNIETDYADINITTIDMFIDYGLEDFFAGRESRAEYVYGCLVQLYEEAKTELEDLLSGKTEPKPAYYYRGDEFEIKNQIFYSEMENSLTGETEVRPVFWNGYNGNAAYAEEMNSVGANSTQFETAMYYYMSKEGEAVPGWYTQRQGGSTVTWGVSTDEHKSGKYSARLSSSDILADYRYGGIYQNLNLKGGETYKFSVNIKADNSSASWAPLGFGVDSIQFLLDGNYDWKKWTYEYTPKEDMTIMTQINMSKAAGDLFIDDYKVVEKSTGKDLVVNGDFETPLYTKDGYSFDMARAKADVVTALDKCYENNMTVDLLLSVHYWPTQILPQEVWQSNNTYWLQYNIYNEEVQKLTQVFMEGMAKTVAGHPALSSICVANEPIFKIARDQSNLPTWHEWLKKLYNNDLDAMNRAYGTEFASFDEVPLEELSENTVIHRDYIHFNDEMFTGWHQMLADAVRKYAPDTPLHTKAMSVINGTEESWWGLDSKINGGINPEMLAKIFDLNGNDCWNFLYEGSTKTGISKSCLYDMLTSFNNAPCYNSEDHVTADRDERYTPEMAPHIAADLWQGAIHGRSATAVWIWARTTSFDGDVAANIKHRPDAVALEGRTMLDLQRLSYEIEALQNQPRKAAVLYSSDSRLYTRSCMNTIYQAYEQLSMGGIKTLFVTENMLAEGNALDGIELLVIPNAVSTTEESVSAVKKYMENGGKVVVLGDSFLYDEHKLPLENQEDVDYIMANAYCVAGTVENENTMILEEDLHELFIKMMKEAGSYDVELIEKETGKNATTVEWTTCEYNGKTLVNLCHYDWSGDLTVVIKKNGEVVNEFTELRSGDVITDGEITLKTSQPVLIEF